MDKPRGSADGERCCADSRITNYGLSSAQVAAKAYVAFGTSISRSQYITLCQSCSRAAILQVSMGVFSRETLAKELAPSNRHWHANCTFKVCSSRWTRLDLRKKIWKFAKCGPAPHAILAKELLRTRRESTLNQSSCFSRLGNDSGRSMSGTSASLSLEGRGVTQQFENLKLDE